MEDDKKQMDDTKKQKRKERSREYFKGYYENNRDKIIKRLGEKVECPVCGRLFSRGNIGVHKFNKLCVKLANEKLKIAELTNSVKDLSVNT